MKKEDLIKLLKEINFNEKDVSISCQPEVSSYEMINGEGIDKIQYETLISIKHQEITRKYTRIGLTKIYEDEKIKEEDKKIPEKINTIGSKWYSNYIESYIDEEDKYSCYDELLMNKINEIIDYLESKGE